MSSAAAAVPLFSGDFAIAAKTLWVDDSGDTMADRALALRQIPRRQNKPIEAYWVCNLGGAVISPAADVCSALFSAKASEACINGLVRTLSEHEAPFELAAWTRSQWRRSPRLISVGAAREWIAAEQARNGKPQTVPLNIFEVTEIPLTSLPAPLASIHDTWLASDRRADAALYRRLALAQVEPLTSIVTLGAPARFQRVGTTFAGFDEAWRAAATGKPVAALPDPVYGRNLERQFTAASQARQPLAYRLITALRRASAADPSDMSYVVETHTGVILPLASSKGPALLAATIATPDSGA